MSSLTAMALASLASAAASLGMVRSRFSRSARRALTWSVLAAACWRCSSNLASENVLSSAAMTALCRASAGTFVEFVQTVLPRSRWAAQMYTFTFSRPRADAINGEPQKTWLPGPFEPQANMPDSRWRSESPCPTSWPARLRRNEFLVPAIRAWAASQTFCETMRSDSSVRRSHSDSGTFTRVLGPVFRTLP